MWDKRAKIASVHDGDTVTVILDQGFGDTKEIAVRLLGVYAPELSQVGGSETRAFVDDWVRKYNVFLNGWSFVVTTARGPRSDKEKTTLSRYLALVETVDHGHNLNVDVQAFVDSNGYTGGIGLPS